MIELRPISPGPGDGALLHLPRRRRSRPTPAAFLDRDATLLDVDGYLTRPADVRLLEGAAEAVQRIHRTHAVVVVTNQSAVARGLLDSAGLLAIHEVLLAALGDAPVDAIVACPHADGSCDCRKPAPGMLLAAARELSLDLSASVLFGDADRDLEAAARAGVRGVRIAANEPNALLFAVRSTCAC